MSLCRGSSGSAGRLHNTTRTAVSRSRRVVKTVIYIAVFVNAWSAALLCRVVFLAAGRSLFAPLPPEQEVQQSTGSFQDSACLHDDDCVVSVDSVGGTASVKTLDDSHGSGLAPHFGLDFIRAAALKFGGPSYAVAETESQSCVESAALDFEVSLHVFAWKRVKSLNRLLDSLLKADYDGSSRASIVFHLDGGWAEEVEQVVDSFQWLHGPKSVVKSRENLGLKRMMAQAWNPASDTDVALFLEDDVEVSPLFFKYAYWCARTFLLPTPLLPGIIGCSLYTPRVDEINECPDPSSPPLWRPSTVVGPSRRLFLFQLPCSWGGLYAGGPWRRFASYLERRINGPADDALFEVPNSRSNLWHQSWKRYLIEHMWRENLTMVYPSFDEERSFTTNHYEEGVHSVPEGRRVEVPDRLRATVDERFAVPLMGPSDERRVFLELPLGRCEALRRQSEMVLVDVYHKPQAKEGIIINK